MTKCPTCNRVIYKKDPLTVIGTCIGGLIASGVVILLLAGFWKCIELLIKGVAGSFS